MDDQSYSRIHEETEAFLQIADQAERGKTTIISSHYVKFEIDHPKFEIIYHFNLFSTLISTELVLR